MADVVHADMTDPDLHEPKGVAAASADQVYVSDGGGSGNWTDLADAIPGDSFIQSYIANESQSSGTNGGTFTSGSYVTRTLNNEVYNGIDGASLAGSSITLPAGTYFVIASAPAVSVGNHKARLWNGTDSAVLVEGTSEAAGGSTVGTRSWIIGSFTLAGTKAVRIQHRCSTTISTTGLGAAAGYSVNEIYSTIQIWKLDV